MAWLLNAYNGSHQYYYAVKHEGQPFFTATNGSSSTVTANFSPSNPEAGALRSTLQQLPAETDLNNNTVALYNLITPDQFNDMHSSLNTPFTIQGRHLCRQHRSRGGRGWAIRSTRRPIPMNGSCR